MSAPTAYAILPPDVLAWEALKAETIAPQLYADAVFMEEVGPRAFSWDGWVPPW